MTVHSFQLAKLDAVLQAIGKADVPLEGELLDDAAIAEHANDFFDIGRRAYQLAAGGPSVTVALAARWAGLGPAQRLLAAMVAQVAPAPEIVVHLEACLDAGQPYLLRHEAVEALGSAPTPAVRDTLERAASDEDHAIRGAALGALRSLDAAASLGVFEAALEDPDPQVRREAIEGVAKIPGGQTARHLLAALADPQMGNAFAAKKALLARRDERDLVADMVARLDDDKDRGRYTLSIAVELLDRLRDARAIDPLIAHLEISRNREVKKAIVKALAKFKQDDRVLRGLWLAIDDRDAEVQVAALEALRKRPAEASLEPLGALAERLPARAARSARAAAASNVPEALVLTIDAMPEPGCVALLEACLTSALDSLCVHAAAALAHRGVGASPALLRERIEREEAHHRAERLHAAFAKLVPEGALTAPPRPDPSPPRPVPAFTRDELRQQLDGMEPSQAVAYVGTLIDQPGAYREVLFQALHKLPGPESSLLLRRFLTGEDGNERGMAANELERRGFTDLSARDRVAQILVSPAREHHRLREYGDDAMAVIVECWPRLQISAEAFRMLWESGHPSRVEAAMVAVTGVYGDRELMKAAFDALRTVAQVAEPLLLERLHRRHGSVLDYIKLLGRIKSKAAVEALLERIDPDADERQLAACAEALGQIRDARAVAPLIGAVAWVPEGPALRKVYEALVRLGATEAAPAISARALKNPKLAPVRDKALERLSK